MREIKFRCWDKVAGLYLSNGNWTGINQDGNPWLVVEGKGVLGGSDRWVVEQYTGLKDKNGKEIYEGDILQQRGLLALTKVVWDENHAEFQTETINQKNTIQSVFCFDVVEADLSEVIGNIHENPELLGGED